MKTDTFQTNLMNLQGNLLNFAFMLTSNRDDAYDLLQDTTLKAIDNRDKYADNTNFKGWVFTIMRNLFINNYRHASRTAVMMDTSEDLYQVHISQQCTASSPEGSYTVTEITAAINQMSEDIRVPFSMHIAGYRYDEISEQMGIPVGTIKSRIFAARKGLQKRFSAYRH